MDAATLIILVILAIVIIAGIILYFTRRSPSNVGGRPGEPPGWRAEAPPPLMAPPPTAEPPEEEPRRTRSARDLFSDQEAQPITPAPGSTPVVPPPPQGAPSVQPSAVPKEMPSPATGKSSTGSSPVVPPPLEAPPPPPPSESRPPVAEPPVTATEAKPADSVPAIPTEAVRFSAFLPKEAAVQTWYTLLVYAHIESALSKVQADAAKFKEEMGGVQREVHSSAPAQLARGTEITVVPLCDRVTFNPERVTFKWVEDVHRADFRFRAGSEMADSAGNILISIFVGPLIVATIKGGILFCPETASPPSPDNQAHVTASLYKTEQIFPSYSHDDESIVLACRNAYKALGFEFLRDRDTLRPGEDWNQTLMQMIERADIFQLFWSEHSAKSPYCREEWEYALQQSKTKGGVFIRPVYWEQPFVTPPAELANLHFAYIPLAKPDKP